MSQSVRTIEPERILGHKGPLYAALVYLPGAERSDWLEPALLVWRDGRRGQPVAVPSSRIWQFAERDGDIPTLLEAVQEYAARLYPEGCTKFEWMALAQLVQNHIEDIVLAPPRPAVTQAEFENALAEHEVKVTQNGEILVDAS